MKPFGFRNNGAMAIVMAPKNPSPPQRQLIPLQNPAAACGCCGRPQRLLPEPAGRSSCRWHPGGDDQGLGCARGNAPAALLVDGPLYGVRVARCAGQLGPLQPPDLLP
eukprot:5764547-Prymnesium_polylepis.1